MPRYSIEDQNRVTLATFALHNFIRRSIAQDPAFRIIDEDPDFIPADSLPDVVNDPLEDASDNSRTREMSTVRDNIASSLVAARRRRMF